MPHLHHGITCDFEEDSLWCPIIEDVFARIQEAAPDDYAFLCGHVPWITELLPQEVQAGVGASYYAGSGGIALCPDADCGDYSHEKREYVLVHELAHAVDIGRAGIEVGVPALVYEQHVDQMLANWDFSKPQEIIDAEPPDLIGAIYAQPRIAVADPSNPLMRKCPSCEVVWFQLVASPCAHCGTELVALA